MKKLLQTLHHSSISSGIGLIYMAGAQQITLAVPDAPLRMVSMFLFMTVAGPLTSWIGERLKRNDNEA
jgi:hypothetical protein